MINYIKANKLNIPIRKQSCMTGKKKKKSKYQLYAAYMRYTLNTKTNRFKAKKMGKKYSMQQTVNTGKQELLY